MTRILIILNAELAGGSWLEDARTWRELVMEINLGRLRVGDDTFNTSAAQSACYVSELSLVVVTFEPPLIVLSPRLYQVLWNLADGKTGQEMALDMKIQALTVYFHYSRLKECFGVETIEDVLVAAEEYGLI